MSIEVIVPTGVFDSRKRFGYSQAYKAGNTIYLAGQGPWDENGNIIIYLLPQPSRSLACGSRTSYWR